MNTKYPKIISTITMLMSVSFASAEEPVHWGVVDTIMTEAFEHSEVMDNASWLTDVYGPRNSKSPSYIGAANWAKDKLLSYGLSNAIVEPYKFGVGYVNEYISVHMMTPQYMPIIVYPATWSSGTNGKVTGHAVYINLNEIGTKEELEQYKGKLQNAVVLANPKQKLSPHFEAPAKRYTTEQLDDMAKIKVGPRDIQERGRRNREESDRLTQKQILQFLFDEGTIAVVRTDGRSDFGTVVVENNSYTMNNRLWEESVDFRPTVLVMAAEHYNRIMRILEKDIPVELELDVRVSFNTEDLNDYNVLAEIPGTDLADEIVLLGAHLQANPAGMGAADDAAGVVACMEVMRIFQALGIKPRRTVRLGLWGGHEMGVFGNTSHVRKNFADVQTKEYKKDYDALSAYFNADAGSGRIRAVPIQGNETIRSIFTEWMKPLHSIGMAHLLDSGSEHESYQEVGLPSYYFVQDRMDERQYHANMDAYDRLVAEDLMANSVILATFVYHAAMRDEKLPRFVPPPW